MLGNISHPVGLGLWLNADGMATSWETYSLSYWHNVLEPNTTLHFTDLVNTSRGGGATAMNSLQVFDASHGAVHYDFHGLRFYMNFSLE